ncbi:hypothetical protein C6P46_004817 [Rhodotorula mucilaginosa]|uniref:S-adenosyl-L-methionine-dependent methyltransferase n=1 Tax=Rhodotorula mucilaginosa TaxID=5537 RepID=A0A9P6VZY8_RHOMI|nr:hypothetical protein C6P46_004817 [Rhodotorula mucilaginosa]
MLDVSTAAVCTLVLAAAGAGYISWRRPRAASELYDDADAILLNLKPPETRWFNMGYWIDSVGPDDFPRAAEQLCRTVAQAARLQRGERICVSPRRSALLSRTKRLCGLRSLQEVGYGSGDSTLLLAKEFSPRSYIGYTSLAAQQKIAGSFNTRADFLSAAHRVLGPGGRIALTDLLLPTEALSLLDHILLRILFYCANTPRKNFLQPAQYRAQLVDAGFDPDSITMRDISDDVWPGFCRFMRERDRQMGRATILGSAWRGLLMYTRVVEWYSGLGGGRRRLRFYLVSASRTGQGT